MEYIFTNLPQYVRVTSRSEFSSSVVHSGNVLLFSEDGTTLTAKLPDGSFVTVGGSGGTDVSDTTAQAANVQSGYYFYNSAGVKTEGTLTVSGGVDVSDTTATSAMVLSGAVFHDSTGAVTTGTIPTVSAAVSSGAVVVPAGYIANSQSFPVSSGGGTDVILGYVENGYFYELAFSGTSSIENNVSAGLSNYQWNLPEPEPVSSGVVLMTSGAVVSSAASMSSVGLSFGDELYIYSGGVVDHVSATRGTAHVSRGGYLSGAVLSSGGQLYVHNGGVVSDLNVWTNGSAVIGFGALVESATTFAYIALTGGTINNLNVYDLGYVSATGGTVNSMAIESRGFIYVQNATISSATLSTVQGAMSILSGGKAYNTDIQRGYLNISSGGIASNIIVSSAGHLTVSSGGTALGVDSRTSADITVDSGGYIEYVNS